MTDVFISYSRRDKAFVRALCDALQTQNHQICIDWDGIRSSQSWKEEIAAGIRAAARFVYILSPDSLASKYWNWEVEHAITLKKLISVLCQEVDLNRVHSEIIRLQLISFCGEDDSSTALEKLISVIGTDIEYDRLYAKLERRAQDWVERDRQDGWLRGADLEEAEIWLATSADKTPAPSPLHRDYITASRQERQQELERWRFLYETAERRRVAAKQNKITAFCKSSEALFVTGRPFDALIEALRAGRRRQQADWATAYWMCASVQTVRCCFPPVTIAPYDSGDSMAI